MDKGTQVARATRKRAQVTELGGRRMRGRHADHPMPGERVVEARSFARGWAKFEPCFERHQEVACALRGSLWERVAGHDGDES